MNSGLTDKSTRCSALATSSTTARTMDPVSTVVPATAKITEKGKKKNRITLWFVKEE